LPGGYVFWKGTVYTTPGDDCTDSSPLSVDVSVYVPATPRAIGSVPVHEVAPAPADVNLVPLAYNPTTTCALSAALIVVLSEYCVGRVHDAVSAFAIFGSRIINITKKIINLFTMYLPFVIFPLVY
jgi:hypothetical protein